MSRQLVQQTLFSLLQENNDTAFTHSFTKEALVLLTHALKDPSYRDHPGLLHTYIHLAEKNLDDPLGEMAATRLATFSHGVIAHYTHM